MAEANEFFAQHLLAYQLPPPRAKFDVIGSVAGRNVLLRLASREIVLIAAANHVVTVLSRRPWGWKFPKRLFEQPMHHFVPDWGETDDMGRAIRAAMVLGGMMGIFADCNSVAEVQSICLAGFENPADVGARVFEMNAKLMGND